MKNMKSFGSRWWATIIWIMALLIVVITFTPLILNPGKVTPRLLSLPFTLWTGIVAAIRHVISVIGIDHVCLGSDFGRCTHSTRPVITKSIDPS